MKMLNYKQSGVDIDKADALTEIIRKTVASDNIGMFAGLYEHPFIPEYYLVACTDGVGTKVIPLIERGLIDTIAVDLVAMNLNDMICTGAMPMFFLDYFATSALDVDITAKFITALKNVLSKYNCMLLGGETAELNDLIAKGHFDVGGFAVGIVKKDKVLSKDTLVEGDIVIGLRSSGPHSNGYTLVRKLHEKGFLTDEDMNDALQPTNIYVNEIIELCNKQTLKACAHITGGGLADNLARAIPDGLCADIYKKNIPSMPIFKKIASAVGEEESYKTFNMGVGMCLIASSENLDEIMKVCAKFEPFILGRLEKDEKNCRVRLG
ncbi:MAG: phosphoribosylformylglycinamidine cyclo-ligase [Candidatus Melainabacteria bacterium GWF2_32_7]|nr:MAG: phosphoribosylformylglycinamidine cyclo-ligase [Candidatus Melainabacteria bacterium GWF2_32_7]